MAGRPDSDGRCDVSGPPTVMFVRVAVSCRNLGVVERSGECLACCVGGSALPPTRPELHSVGTGLMPGRYGLQCADPPVIKRKGRPPNSSRRLQETSVPPSNSQTQTQSLFPQAYQPPSSPGKPDLFPMSFPYAGISPPLQMAQAQSLVDLSRSGPHSSSTTTLSPTSGNYASSRNQNLNMAEFLDPAEGSSAKAPFYSSAPARRGYAPDADEEGTSETDDPVSLRALSEVEANQLVQLCVSPQPS